MNLALINSPIFQLILILMVVTVHIGCYTYKYLAVDIINYIFRKKESGNKENRKFNSIFFVLTFLMFLIINQLVEVESSLSKQYLLILIIFLAILFAFVHRFRENPKSQVEIIIQRVENIRYKIPLLNMSYGKNISKKLKFKAIDKNNQVKIFKENNGVIISTDFYNFKKLLSNEILDNKIDIIGKAHRSRKVTYIPIFELLFNTIFEKYKGSRLTGENRKTFLNFIITNFTLGGEEIKYNNIYKAYNNWYP